jgi:hypothetical protein
MRLFADVRYDPRLEVTEFVWGLDRTFGTSAEPARLVYRDADDVYGRAVALGQHFVAPGLEFRIDFGPDSKLSQCLMSIWNNPQSAVYQSLLWQQLHAFLLAHARHDPDPGAPPMIPGAVPSVFVVRNLVKVVALHLLLRWHPVPNTGQVPAQPFRPTLADVVHCLTLGHAAHIDQNRFDQLCQILVEQENPTSPQERMQILTAQWENFANACTNVGLLTPGFFLQTSRRLLLNTLGISLHTAGLLLTGAEDHDLAYFYKEHTPEDASIYLFDTDQFGNGTCQLIRENFYISPVERTLVARRAALGQTTDPLPTTDFVTCLEESLQECDHAQAGHLAFHDANAAVEPFAELAAATGGERQTAGAVFDFVRAVMGLDSYDDLVPLAICPEFLAHITSPASGYAAYHGHELIGSPSYPTFQSLEDAMGACVYGCLACVVSPEQNVHGPLAAKTTVNKLLLDATYLQVVCEGNVPHQQATPLTQITYPGQAPGRTCMWPALAQLVAASNARPLPGIGPVQVRLVELQGGQPAVDVQVVVAATPGPFARAMRTGFDRLGVPQPRIRPRMIL